MSLRKLKVLMWKHLMVRIRRYFHTAIELLCPLVIFVLLFKLRHLVNPPVKGYLMETGIQNRTYDSRPLIDPELYTRHKILYFPSTTITDALMDEVGRRLGDKRDETNSGYFGKHDDTGMKEFMQSMSPSDAIIQFPELHKWPKTLNYTIRMKDNFETGTVVPEGEFALSPHRNYGYVYDMFMSLQWAVDTSFISLASGHPIQLHLEVEEFPYNRVAKVTGVLVVCKLLPLLCWVALLLPFIFLLGRLLEERSTGIQSLIQMVGVSTNLVGISHFLNSIPAGLVFSIGGAVLLTTSDNPVLPNVSPLLIFVLLLLHYVSFVACAMAVSYVVKSTNYATSLASSSYILTSVPLVLLRDVTLSRPVLLLKGLLPLVPLEWFWTEVSALEQGGGLQISSMFKSHHITSFSAVVCYLMLIIHALIYFFLAWYLSKVRPGNYQQAEPWNFLCRKSYWSSVTPAPEADEVELSSEEQYFEPPPPAAHVGISVQRVSKIYGNNQVLKNVTFDVLKGEITVLLGHNGAGKTTLMSIVTGMVSASSGNVSINGIDTRRHMTAARAQLGLCPQHNLYFPSLTVLEHLMFFAMLKGDSRAEAKSSSREMLARMNMEDKDDDFVCNLSGGMKRRVQLACALAGRAPVLILDEPTAGLDVEHRRQLWDLLLALRGGRTVVLSTHVMEEADALGDRVVALHRGRLRCRATPMFLKKAVGTGYRLTCTTIGLPKEEAITNTITSVVPDATVKETTLNCISFSLPADQNDKLPTLFTKLEDNRSSLGIDSMGMGTSTLEEVFLRLCSDTETKFSKTDEDAIEVPTFTSVSRCTRLGRQACVLLLRQVRYLMSRWISFLLWQVTFPILAISLVMYLSNSNDDEGAPKANVPLQLDPGIYKMVSEPKAIYNLMTTNYSIKDIASKYPNVKFVETSDQVGQRMLRTGQTDLFEYSKYLFGIELNSTNAKVLYTTLYRHAAPAGLSALSNALGAPHALSVTTVNAPLTHRPPRAPALAQPRSLVSCVTWSILIVTVILSTAISLVSLVCAERVSNARHMHLMSGCGAALYWLVCFCFHAALLILTMIIPVMFAEYFGDALSTFNNAPYIGITFIILVLGCMAFLGEMYLISFWMGDTAASALLYGLVVLGAFIIPFAKVPSIVGLETDVSGIAKFVFVLSEIAAPPTTMTMAFVKASYVAQRNALCDLNVKHCPNFMVFEQDFDAKECCEKMKGTECYYCFKDKAPLKEILLLVVQALVYMSLVILQQRGALRPPWQWCGARGGGNPPPHKYHDEMVRAEKQYVSKAIDLPKKQITDAMLVSDLHKYYTVGLRCKKVRAVNGISFSVKKGECFGLLGVNGAGKSSTFKILSCEERASRGRVVANQHDVRFGGKYMHSIGYCPQFFGLDTFLTGQQNLELILTLRGLTQRDVAREAAVWIAIVGLEKYKHKSTSTYSGGCLRRLGTAAALCTAAPLSMLDEPTAGVDVAARRRVWAAVRRAARARCAIVVTSHSMDEMEALCERIGIMSSGELAALGTAPGLKAAHARGHTLRVKLRTERAAVPEIDNWELRNLKQELAEKLQCQLKDEHVTVLLFTIPDTMRYSELFTVLEEIRAKYYDLVEDYAVTEATLEQVFLSFANNELNEALDKNGPQAV